MKSIIICIFFLTGCASNYLKILRPVEGNVEPYPSWTKEYHEGTYYPSLIHNHNLGEELRIHFPDGFKWGISYKVRARYTRFRPDPELKDANSKTYYLVEEVISQTAVPTGYCFSLEGKKWMLVSKFPKKSFLQFFEPNKASFANSHVTSKFENFFKDKKAQYFNARVCFGKAPDLNIEISDFRYDQ